MRAAQGARTRPCGSAVPVASAAASASRRSSAARAPSPSTPASSATRGRREGHRAELRRCVAPPPRGARRRPARSPSVAASSPSASDAEPDADGAAPHRHDPVAVGRAGAGRARQPRARRRAARRARRAPWPCRASSRRGVPRPGSRPRPRARARRVDVAAEQPRARSAARQAPRAGERSARPSIAAYSAVGQSGRCGVGCAWRWTSKSSSALSSWALRPMRAPSSREPLAPRPADRASSASAARQSGTYQS